MGDRYEIKRKIGQGGVGAVYHAFDTKLQRNVALKRMRPLKESRAQTDAAKGLEKEASIISSLQNPNIITVYDAGTDENGAFVVMELIEGQTLDKIVRMAALQIDDFRQVVEQSLGGLIAAQNVGLLHRDLKPKNIMVAWLPSGNFQLKILDFGLAKFSVQPSFQTVDHSDNISGSIHVMAPEQFERLQLDSRTDIYAMGCVYYFALTQKYPFTGENPGEVMNSHLHHHLKPIREIRADLGQGYCDWITRLISREPNDRPQDARTALREFQEIDPNTGAAPVCKPAGAPLATLIPQVASTASRSITGPTGPITAAQRTGRPTTDTGTSTSIAALRTATEYRTGAVPQAPSQHWTNKPPEALLYTAFVLIPAIAFLIAVSVYKSRDTGESKSNGATTDNNKPSTKGKSIIPPLPMSAHRVAHFAAHVGTFKGTSNKGAVETDRVGRWTDQADTVAGNNALTHPSGNETMMPTLEFSGKQVGLKGRKPVLRFRKGDEISVLRNDDDSGFAKAFDGNQLTWFILFKPSANGKSHLVAALDEMNFSNSVVTWYRVPNYESGVRRTKSPGDLSTSLQELGNFLLLTFVWDGTKGEQFQTITTPNGKRTPGSLERVRASPVEINCLRIGATKDLKTKA